MNAVRGTNHFRGVGAGAAAHYSDVSIRRDRLALARKSHVGDGSVAPEGMGGNIDRVPEAWIAGGVPARAHHNGERIASLPAEMPLDHRARRH